MSAARRPSTPTAFGAGKHSNGSAPRAKLAVDVLVEAVAQRAAAIVIERQAMAVSPWMSTEQAAEYLAAKPARIHDLVALGKLTPRRDGRRLLFRRDDLDAYIEGSG